MTLYLLIAILAMPGGQADEYILDHDLTYEDCQQAKDAGLRFDGPQLRRLQNVTVECRIEKDQSQ